MEFGFLPLSLLESMSSMSSSSIEYGTPVSAIVSNSNTIPKPNENENTEKRPPNKSNEEFNDFFNALDSYSPTVPEAVVKYNLQKSGAAVMDRRILKLVGLATDKFLSDVIKEASEISKLRSHKRKSDPTLELVSSILS